MSKEQSIEVIKYLKNKYIEYGLLDADGNHTIPATSHWDPYIYPGEGYIPYCQICQEDYNEYKKDTTRDEYEMDHSKSCLWYDYFVGRIKILNPKVSIRTKRNDKNKDGKQKK